MTTIEDSYLPSTLLEISELIGLTAVCSLVKQYGGTEIYVPGREWLKSRDDFSRHELIELLGMDAALKLAYRYGPGRLKIAKADKAARKMRNAVIAYGHYFQHKSYSTLAGEFRLDVRWIIEICRVTPIHKLGF